MGLFDGRSASATTVPRTHHRSHSSRAESPARSVRSASGAGYFVRPGANSSSNHNTRSPPSGSFYGGTSTGSRGIFGFGGGGSGSSYYKRRPRDGYIAYLVQKLKRMLQELWVYARKHPVKAFFAVVVPLLSAGGAIHGLMRQFGVRMPLGLDGQTRRSGGGYYGSTGYGSSGLGGGIGGMGGGGGLMENAGSLFQVAKMFM